MISPNLQLLENLFWNGPRLLRYVFFLFYDMYALNKKKFDIMYER